MNEKKTVWRLYSGASWTLNELFDVLKYAMIFAGIGVFLGWLATVSFLML